MLTVAVVGMGAAAALSAAPALAGEINYGNGKLNAAVYNVTPYPLTLVGEGSPAPLLDPQFTNCDDYNPGQPDKCWLQLPSATIAPGGASGFVLGSNEKHIGCVLGSTWYYDGWFTYRVDVLGGPPEYMTVAITGNTAGCAHDNATVAVFNTTAALPAGYDPAIIPLPPAPPTSNPQITYTHNLPYLYDQSFELGGDHTFDARSNQGQALAGVLNALCVNAASTSCSFAQVGALKWGIGATRKVGLVADCTLGKADPGASGSAGGSGLPPPPPSSLEPDWFEVDWGYKQSASLTVGGSLTVSAEASLFGVVSGEISVEVEAEHEWTETKEFERSIKVFIPSNDIAGVYVAPTVGTVTGTLTLTSGAGTLTLTNFSETRSGVTRDPLTPALDSIVRIRPMTAAEFKDTCSVVSTTKGLGAPPPRAAVDKVKRGQRRDQVLTDLGTPVLQRFRVNTCRAGNADCDALGGRGATWVYPGLLVAFGANGRVTAVIPIDDGRLGRVTA